MKPVYESKADPTYIGNYSDEFTFLLVTYLREIKKIDLHWENKKKNEENPT